MASKTYRVGIVGLSGIAAGAPRTATLPPFAKEVTVSHAASLDYVPDTEVVGYCDLLPEMLDNFKRKWGDRWPRAMPYTDYKRMLSEADIDILAVATSDHRHADITVDGANAGVKGIFVEKPLATSLEDADRMIKACDDNGVVISVDHTRRWSPHYHNVRNIVRSGAIGPLSTIIATLGGRRAMVFRNGTHMIDTVCFYAESEPAQVFASLEPGFEDWDRYRGDGGKLPENDPGVSGIILFKNGVRALYCGTKETYQEFSLQLSGRNGQIHVDGQGATMLTNDAAGDTVSKELVAASYQVHGLVAAYKELIGLIEGGGEGISTAREARKTVQILIGFLRSQQEGGCLVDVPA